MNLITINSLLKGYAGKVSFVYHSELAVYTTSMSHMGELGEIASRNEGVK